MFENIFFGSGQRNGNALIERLVKHPQKDHGGFETFKFQHDSLQQASISLIDEGERPGILLKIGRLLLSKLAPEQINDRLFEIVNNLNAGFEFINDREERVQLLKLNMEAGRKAYAATAYSAALQYYRNAYRLLEIPGFTDYLWEDSSRFWPFIF